MSYSNMNETNSNIDSNYDFNETDFKDNNPYPEISSFDDLEIADDLLRGIYSFGYEIPSAIQRKSITPMIKGDDLIAQAQSGSGKTATFLIGAMQRVDRKLQKPQVIIICPNRELAQQIYYNFECLNQYTKITSTILMGGTQVDENYKILEKGVQFIVGTPGRVYDMMKRYILKTDALKCFVMDEADEMLSKGFKDQIYEIFQFIPPKCQVCIFSATMPKAQLDLTKKFIPTAVRILVQPEKLTVEGIRQYYLGVEHESWKLETLYDLYERLQISQTIIFVNSIHKAKFLAEKLEEEKFVVDCIHGEMSQVQRDKIMNSFRRGESRVLVATDVIARGIDVQQVSIVINYDMPRYYETYIHRIGRSGRYGRKGIAINFVTDREYPTIEKIQRIFKTTIEELPDNIKNII